MGKGCHYLVEVYGADFVPAGTWPASTTQPIVRKIEPLRWHQRPGPVEIGERLDMSSLTAHAVLIRCRLDQLAHRLCHRRAPL